MQIIMTSLLLSAIGTLAFRQIWVRLVITRKNGFSCIKGFKLFDPEFK